MTEIWLQGGPADGFKAFVVGNIDKHLGDTLHVIPHPTAPGEWVVVDELYSRAVRYERVRAVEQLDGERIYYPAPDQGYDGETP